MGRDGPRESTEELLGYVLQCPCRGGPIFLPSCRSLQETLHAAQARVFPWGLSLALAHTGATVCHGCGLQVSRLGALICPQGAGYLYMVTWVERHGSWWSGWLMCLQIACLGELGAGARVCGTACVCVYRLHALPTVSPVSSTFPSQALEAFGGWNWPILEHGAGHRPQWCWPWTCVPLWLVLPGPHPQLSTHDLFAGSKPPRPSACGMTAWLWSEVTGL